MFLVLTGSSQVEAVLEGRRPGSVVIDCSAVVPSSGGRMAPAVQAAGTSWTAR